jgi:glutaconate CoA-transferase subunit A
MIVSSTLGLAGYQLARRPVGLVLKTKSEGRWEWDSAFTVFGSVETDMAVSIPNLRSLTYASVSLGIFGLAPTVRRRAETGSLTVFPRGANDLVYALAREAARSEQDDRTSVNGQDVLTQRLRLDAVFMHLPFANPKTGYAWGYAPGLDFLFASVAERLVISYDVAVESPPLLPNLFVMPPDAIASLIHMPFGAFPTSCWPLYGMSAPFLAEYARRSVDSEWIAHLPTVSSELVLESMSFDDIGAMLLSNTDEIETLRQLVDVAR